MGVCVCERENRQKSLRERGREQKPLQREEGRKEGRTGGGGKRRGAERTATAATPCERPALPPVAAGGTPPGEGDGDCGEPCLSPTPHPTASSPKHPARLGLGPPALSASMVFRSHQRRPGEGDPAGGARPGSMRSEAGGQVGRARTGRTEPGGWRKRETRPCWDGGHAVERRSVELGKTGRAGILQRVGLSSPSFPAGAVLLAGLGERGWGVAREGLHQE